MVPIKIDEKVKKMSNQKLSNLLNQKAYAFCTYTNFSNTESTIKAATRLEMLAMEALMRIFESGLGFRPYQNKIYDNVEKLFSMKDSYNINRMFSSLRRIKYFNGVDATDEKYVRWLKNRISFGSRVLSNELRQLPEEPDRTFILPTEKQFTKKEEG